MRTQHWPPFCVRTTRKVIQTALLLCPGACIFGTGIRRSGVPGPSRAVCFTKAVPLPTPSHGPSPVIALWMTWQGLLRRRSHCWSVCALRPTRTYRMHSSTLLFNHPRTSPTDAIASVAIADRANASHFLLLLLPSVKVCRDCSAVLQISTSAQGTHTRDAMQKKRPNNTSRGVPLNRRRTICLGGRGLLPICPPKGCV